MLYGNGKAQTHREFLRSKNLGEQTDKFATLTTDDYGLADEYYDLHLFRSRRRETKSIIGEAVPYKADTDRKSGV